MTNRRKPLLALVAALALGAVGFLGITSAGATVEHCPNHNVAPNIKDESGSDDNGLVPAAGTVICVKASTGNTGVITADGETTLREYLFAAGIVDGSGKKGRDVSYWVIYPSTTTTTVPVTTPTTDGTTTTTVVEETTTTTESPPATLVPPTTVERPTPTGRPAVPEPVEPTYTG